MQFGLIIIIFIISDFALLTLKSNNITMNSNFASRENNFMFMKMYLKKMKLYIFIMWCNIIHYCQLSF